MFAKIDLGKEFGIIDFSKVKSGISKDDLGIEEGTVLANIFDSVTQMMKATHKVNLIETN